MLPGRGTSSVARRREAPSGSDNMESWAAEAPALGWGDRGVLNIVSPKAGLPRTPAEH